ncbi:PQQ-dependent sugar dehydrogenase [Vibrio chagasii]|nr:PQQ-dependent sugar dehydrogenase [Vibrio chagasii]
MWSFGHRNPQGLFYLVAKPKLWSIEHGPRSGDEINLIKAGANYGWPVTSRNYGIEMVETLSALVIPKSQRRHQNA